MILSDSAILAAIDRGDIVIDPFDRSCLGGNSYDVHLGSILAVYRDTILDSKLDNQVDHITIPRDGAVLAPGTLYLGSTAEYTETKRYVPYVDGKSSVGRLGVSIHATAGRGDVGFSNHWTLEMFVVQPVRVYSGMPIGQLTYHSVVGEVLNPYSQKPSAKYTQQDPRPQRSAMWRNFR